MGRESPDIELVVAWFAASRDDRRTLLMILESLRESERVGENAWVVRPGDASRLEA